MRRAAAGALAAVLMVGAAAAQVIDRILAVAEGRLMTLSDVRAVQRFGLEPPKVAEDPVAAVLDQLIDRQLILIEVERYAPPEPAPAAIDARMSAIRAAFKDALAFETALHETGLTEEELRRYVRDSLRIETYLQQRFAGTIQPGEEEVARYYREHEREFVRDGVPRPFAEVRDEIRARMIVARRETLIQEWLEGLRRRANVVRLYLR
jgi:hypothetical protein